MTEPTTPSAPPSPPGRRVGRRDVLVGAGAFGVGAVAAAAVSAATFGREDEHRPEQHAVRESGLDPTGAGEILQPGKGPTSGAYLQATPANVLWGELPNRRTKPVLTVKSGAEVTVDTVSHEGILEDQGRNPVRFFGTHGVPENEVLLDAVKIAADKEHTGPGPHIVVGPVEVEGAMPGDVLKVEVLRLLRRVPYGVISNRHGRGALPGEYPEAFEKVVAYRKYFNQGNNISIFTRVEKKDGKPRGVLPQGGLPRPPSFGLRPFMGMMGVALDTDERLNSIPPTIGGGNIDIQDLVVGATFYLPVQVRGAKFFTGDPHFAQGHGEVALTALEASVRPTFRLTVVKPGGDAPSPAFRYPFAETPEFWIPIGLSDPDGDIGGLSSSLDPAMKNAVRNAMTFLTEDKKVDGPVAYAYLSAAGDFVVSQVVDRTLGVHGLIRKADFRE
jgi:acetamidase/formamidase